jgi:hypothetical protein
MPKHSVTDPITDKEISFANLVMSGTMNDRQAAEAAGLNPNTAAYTKAKPRVREYMENHRAAMEKERIAQEAEGLRRLTLSRDHILARLWELANLPPDVTRGSIAGQVRAMTMIVAIEGLIPNHRNDRSPSPAPAQLAPEAVRPEIYVSEWLRQRHDEATEPQELVTSMETQPAPAPLHETLPAPEKHSVPDTPRIANWAPNAIGPPVSAYLNPTSIRGKGRFAPGR